MRKINVQQQARTIDNRHLDDIYHVYFVLLRMGLGVRYVESILFLINPQSIYWK